MGMRQIGNRWVSDEELIEEGTQSINRWVAFFGFGAGIFGGIKLAGLLGASGALKTVLIGVCSIGAAVLGWILWPWLLGAVGLGILALIFIAISNRT